MVAELNKWGVEKPRSRFPHKSPHRTSRTNVEPQREEWKIIHFIHEGFVCGGELKEDKRAYAREPIASIATV